MEAGGWRQESEAVLRTYLQENCLPRHAETKLALEENLFDSGILDSAGLISFIAYIEKQFRLTIPDEDLLPENFSSLESLIGYLQSKQRSPSA